MSEFVELYVRLRHPHHYDPSSWPLALWVSFLWPFPVAVWAAQRAKKTEALTRTIRVVALLCGLLVIALIFAGVWYVSEPLVQMSLFRFSIYPKLLTCAAAAMVIDRWATGRATSNRTKPTAVLALLLIPALAAVIAAASWLPRTFLPPLATFLALWGMAGLYEHVGHEARKRVPTYTAIILAALALVIFGWERQPVSVLRDPPDYLAVCIFARDHTPSDAVFVVPPNEEEFRLAARRAIVVNLKGVPQLSSELGEWRDRLCRVLDLPSLRALPHRFDRALTAIGERYDELSSDQLLQSAAAHHARYVVTTRAIDFPAPAKLVFEKGVYRLYDLTP